MNHNIPQPNRTPFIRQRIASYAKRVTKPVPLIVEGRLTRIVGLTLEAVGCQAPIGSRCLIESTDGPRIEAEVVGFSEGKLLLMAIGNIQGLLPNARVMPTHYQHRVPVGDALLGRVLDGAGNPLDDKGAIEATDYVTLNGREINPLQRSPVRQSLDVGVRSINSLLTIGRGQRMGLFAGSGVGKSVLMGMMTRYTNADITIVGLIGERGREVVEFVQNSLGPEGMARAVVVATPADNSPLMRMHGAMLATSIAEYFRDQGKHVLLLMDSLTRFSQAQREIALAIGEPPVTKGYPPSVFFKLPQLVERAGNAEVGGGSITALYTVLTEGDDHNDPIADAARAILDGHIVLSRELAESGLYPAINVEASISRTMTDVVDKSHLEQARRFKQLYSVYQQNKDLITIGAYQAGSDPRIDEAIDYYPRLIDFLDQDMYHRIGINESMDDLDELLSGGLPMTVN